MDTGFNAAVALREDGRLMGLLHAGYGLGAAIGPLVVGASLAAGGGWRPGYVLFAAASLLLVVPLAGRTLGEAPPQQTMGSPRGMLLPCVAFGVYVSLEVTVGQWAFTSLTEHRGLGDLAASAWVALYWVALTAGRLWLGLSGHRAPVHRLLGLSVAGAAAAAVLLWAGGPAAPLGLLVAGLALSVVFPLLMLLTPRRVGAERAAAAVGWQTAAASIGAAAGPALAGIVLDRAGIDAYGPITLALAALLGAVVVALETSLQPA
jgi:fucose permease